MSKVFWSLLIKLFAVAVAVFIVFGLADVKLQRVLFVRKLKMSKDEVKRERKDTDGAPEIKAERKNGRANSRLRRHPRSAWASRTR